MAGVETELQGRHTALWRSPQAVRGKHWGAEVRWGARWFGVSRLEAGRERGRLARDGGGLRVRCAVPRWRGGLSRERWVCEM